MTAEREDDGQIVKLADVIGFVARRRNVLAVVFVVAMICVAAGYKLTPRQYRAEVVIVPLQDVSADLSSTTQGGLSQVTALLGASGGSSWRQESLAFLRSRQLASNALLKMGLMDDLLPDAETSDIPQDVLLSRATRRFQQKVLRVTEDRMSGIVTVAAVWDDPSAASKMANGFVDEANRLAQEGAIRRLQISADFAQKELATASSIEVRTVLLSLIERNYKALSLARARQDYAFRIIDPATPGGRETAVWPKLTTFAAFGAIASAILAVLVGLGIEWRSRRKSSV